MFAYMGYLRTKAKVERMRKPEEDKTKEAGKQP
jgi:hypothetical protein